MVVASCDRKKLGPKRRTLEPQPDDLLSEPLSHKERLTVHKITLASYPNQEIRAVIHRMKAPRPLPEPDWNPEMESDSSSLTLGSNSEPPLEAPEIVPARPGFGVLGRVTKFGNNARRTIMRCGGALDQAVSKDRLIMLTGTLPGSTNDAFRAIAEWSSYLVDRLKSWLSKRWAPQYSFYVWEWQERGALHIHYCVHLAAWEDGESLIADWKMEWYRLLCNVSDRTGIDLFEREDGCSWRKYPSLLQAHAQRVCKSAAAYMAKYCAKSESKDGSCTGVPRYAPVRWWGCSRPLLALLKSLTKRFEKTFTRSHAAHRIFNILAGNLDSYSAKYHTYGDRVTDAIVAIAYQTHLAVEEIWRMSTQAFSPNYAETLKMTMTMESFGRGVLTRILSFAQGSRERLMEESGVSLRTVVGSFTTSERVGRLARLRAMSDYAYALLLICRTLGPRARDAIAVAQRLNTWLLMAWWAEDAGIDWWQRSVAEIWELCPYNGGVPRQGGPAPSVSVSAGDPALAGSYCDERLTPEVAGIREASVQLSIINLHLANMADG